MRTLLYIKIYSEKVFTFCVNKNIFSKFMKIINRFRERNCYILRNYLKINNLQR